MARLDHAELEAAATAILEGFGAPATVAADVAASLVGADLRGHESHGVVRLATAYGSMVEDDALDPRATATVADREGATATVDGRQAFGQHTGRLAVDVGAEKATAHGVAAVGVRNGAHLGRIGEWAERAADRGLAFVAFVNSGLSTPTVTVPGSSDRLLSTNPIAVGLPTFDARPFPLVLDMATSQVAHGKVTRRHVDGDPVPAAWTVTPEGEAVTDAAAFESGTGALLPLGGLTAGYKGFGLATMAELLAGVVGGGQVFGEADPGWVNNGAAFLFVDPLAFSTRERIETVIETFDAYLAEATMADAVPQPPAMHADRPLLPGEPEHRTATRRRAEGIPVSDRTLAALDEVAATHGVDFGH